MTRVIGVGSPFGADRLGWLAIDHLAGMSLPGCELIKLDRPGSCLLAHLRGLRKAVVIDAVALDTSPGGVSLLSFADLQRMLAPPSSHGFGLAETLALGAELGELPPALHLIGIHTGKDLVAPPRLDVAALDALLMPLL
jgi:hydrogenase maturation protease